MHDAVPTQELRPRKGSFVFPRVMPPSLIGLVAGAVLGGALLAAELGAMVAVLSGLGLFAAVVGLSLWVALAAFGKERYELSPTVLRCHKGGLVSDETTDLDVRNITHVKLRLPWLRHMFFHVGDVFVESAGSGGSEVALRSVLEPERVYDEIRQLMQQSGYSLTQGELLHEEQPDLVGVVVECIGLLVTACIALLWAVGGAIADQASDPDGMSRVATVVFTVMGGVAVVGAFFGLIVHFLDLRRRTYRVYDDVVVYEEGFLTRDNAFIPFENIADANTKRTLVDQILGLYDVQVSCQGSGSEIKFRRLRRGLELTRVIGRLVEQASARPGPSSERVSAQPTPGGLDLPGPLPEVKLVPAEQAWTAELKPNLPRVLLGTLPLAPLFPLWVVAAIQAMIQTLSTTYRVRGSSVVSSYQFLSASEREFAYDKITGLVVKESPLDRLFGTFTVRLWSIGASMPLDLGHVKRDEIDLPALLRQAGIPAASPAPYAAEARFSLGAWLRGRLPVAVLIGLAALGILLLGALVRPGFYALAAPLALLTGGFLLYQRLLFDRQRLWFHAGHAEAQVGVFWRSHYYARYGNIKKVQLTRYPGCDQGSLRLFVAGEMRVAPGQTKPGQEDAQKGAAIPYSFTGHFLDGMEQKQRLIDDVLLGRVAPTPEATPAAPLELLQEAQPSLGNTLTRLILSSVLLLPLVALLPLTIPFAVVSLRRRRYRVEAGRVVVQWGILFKSQATVLFSRIDSLRQNQGPLNKLFKNGAVTLFTAGSSNPDLQLSDLPSYKAFYDTIRPHYGKRS